MIDVALWRARYPWIADPDDYDDDFVRESALIWVFRDMAAMLYGICVGLGPAMTPWRCLEHGIPEGQRYVCGGHERDWLDWLRWYDSARGEFGACNRNEMDR